MKENEQKQPQQSKTLFSIPINGCLSIIILSALACIAVKGCKMMNMKYEEQKVKHEIYMEKLKQQRTDTINYTTQKVK